MGSFHALGLKWFSHENPTLPTPWRERKALYNGADIANFAAKLPSFLQNLLDDRW
jgi:hypothetical protein